MSKPERVALELSGHSDMDAILPPESADGDTSILYVRADVAAASEAALREQVRVLREASDEMAALLRGILRLLDGPPHFIREAQVIESLGTGELAHARMALRRYAATAATAQKEPGHE